MAKNNDLFSPTVLANPEVFFRGFQGLSPEEQWQTIFMLNQMANGQGGHPDSLRQSMRNILDIYRMEQGNNSPLPPVRQDGTGSGVASYPLPSVGQSGTGLEATPLPPIPQEYTSAMPQASSYWDDDNLYPADPAYLDDDNLYPTIRLRH